MRQEFVIEGRLPGYNQLKGRCWQAAARTKNEAMETVINYAWHIKPISKKATITIHCFEPDRRRDPDNVQSGANKVILDALQRCWKLPNDNRRWVRLVQPAVDVDREHPRIEVIIEEDV